MTQRGAIYAAVYARYSTDNQDQRSILDQISQCRDSADSKGWIIDEQCIFTDEAISGTSMEPREGLNRLLTLARSGKAPFNYILVDDTARLARDTHDALAIFKELTFLGIHVYFVSQAIDTADKQAETMITIHGLTDKLQVKNIAAETLRTLKRKVGEQFSGGGRRYGYRSEPVYTGKTDIYGNPVPIGYKVIIKSDEAEVIIRIFYLFGEKGYSAKKIANILNKEFKETGIPKPPRKDLWLVTTILGSKTSHRGLLNNELYIGRYVYNRTTCIPNPNTGKKKSIPNDPSEWVTVEIPELRIVSDDLWNKVKARQRDNDVLNLGHFSKGKLLYSRNLLSRIAVCGDCGGTFGVVSGGKYSKYGCTRSWNGGPQACGNTVKIDKSLLEETVITLLYKQLSDEKAMAGIFEEICRNFDKYYDKVIKDVKGAEIEKQLAATTRKIENILSGIEAGIYTKNTKRILVNAENQEEELRNQLNMLSLNSKPDISQMMTVDELKAYSSPVAGQLMNPETTAEALSQIARKIVVKCEKNEVAVLIEENPDTLMGYIFSQLGKKDTRIKMQTGTRLQLYTSRIFQAKISLFSGHIAILDGITSNKGGRS